MKYIMSWIIQCNNAEAASNAGKYLGTNQQVRLQKAQ